MVFNALPRIWESMKRTLSAKECANYVIFEACILRNKYGGLIGLNESSYFISWNDNMCLACWCIAEFRRKTFFQEKNKPLLHYNHFFHFMRHEDKIDTYLKMHKQKQSCWVETQSVILKERQLGLLDVIFLLLRSSHPESIT